MSIRVFILATVVSVTSLLPAQDLAIPNGDFESWETTPWFSLDPEHWATTNGQVVLSVHQDTMAYEGDWGMKILPVPNGIGEEGKASIEIPTAFIPPSLDFYAKWDRTATAGVGVSVTFYNGENSFYSENWSPSELSSEWTPISIELSQIEPIMTHVVIDVGVYIGDFAPGDGWISVDAMSFDGFNGIDDLETPNVSLYPNPTMDFLYIEEADVQTIYIIYDAMGKQLLSDTYQGGLDVSTLSAGQYFIEVITRDGVVRRSPFVVK